MKKQGAITNIIIISYLLPVFRPTFLEALQYVLFFHYLSFIILLFLRSQSFYRFPVFLFLYSSTSKPSHLHPKKYEY